MLSYNESLKILKETEALLEGHFILSSGLHSKQYVRCAKLLSHPKKTNVLIIEDVITTGKSALECSEIIKKNNSKPIGYACIIDRSTTNSLIKDKIISQIKIEIETFKQNELPAELKKIAPIKPGSRNLSK